MDSALTVYIDFKSPYAYLAVEPTRRLARELAIQIDWMPFVLDIPSYLGSARLGSSGEVAEAANGATEGLYAASSFYVPDFKAQEPGSWLANWYAGESHSETAWRTRVHVPLRFLLKDDPE